MRERAVTLPAPLADTWEWQLRARCQYRDVDFFADAPEQVTLAKSVCFSCPVRDECRDYAARAGERHGIWGGVSAEELPHYRWLPPPRSQHRANWLGSEHISRGRIT